MSVINGARLPRNAFERILWLHGRKFWLAFFAGSSSFIVTIAGLLIAGALDDAALASVLERIVSSYLLAAAGIVGAYSASNAVVERAHAKHNHEPPPPPAPRQSGVVTPVEG